TTNGSSSSAPASRPLIRPSTESRPTLAGPQNASQHVEFAPPAAKRPTRLDRGPPHRGNRSPAARQQRSQRPTGWGILVSRAEQRPRALTKLREYGPRSSNVQPLV